MQALLFVFTKCFDYAFALCIDGFSPVSNYNVDAVWQETNYFFIVQQFSKTFVNDTSHTIRLNVAPYGSALRRDSFSVIQHHAKRLKESNERPERVIADMLVVDGVKQVVFDDVGQVTNFEYEVAVTG